MSDERANGKSTSMAEADVANGEQAPDDKGDAARTADPDAPGNSVLGLREGDDVEPNEPG
jgi:hypothetical protein